MPFFHNLFRHPPRPPRPLYTLDWRNTAAWPQEAWNAIRSAALDTCLNVPSAICSASRSQRGCEATNTEQDRRRALLDYLKEHPRAWEKLQHRLLLYRYRLPWVYGDYPGETD